MSKKKNEAEYKHTLLSLYKELESSQSIEDMKKLVRERIDQLTGKPASPKAVAEKVAIPSTPPRVISPSIISVIVPVFDDEPLYLTRCLDSLIEQTYQYLEIILVCYKSTPTITEYAEKDSRIRLIYNTKSNISSSLNLGIDAALSSGCEYIGFCYPHDWVSNSFYETLHRIQIANGADLVQCGSYLSIDLPGSTDLAGRYYSGRETVVQAILTRKVSTDLYCGLYKAYLFQDERFMPIDCCEEMILWQIYPIITKGIARIDHALYHHSIKVNYASFDSEYKKMHFFLNRYYTIIASCPTEANLYNNLCLKALHSLLNEYFTLTRDYQMVRYAMVRETFTKAYSLFGKELKEDRDLYLMVVKGNVNNYKSFRRMFHSTSGLRLNTIVAKKEYMEKVEKALLAEKEALMKDKPTMESDPISALDQMHDTAIDVWNCSGGNNLPPSPADDFTTEGITDTVHPELERYFEMYFQKKGSGHSRG